MSTARTGRRSVLAEAFTLIELLVVVAIIAQGRPLDETHEPGKLGMTPWGLGNLIWGNYIGDVRSLFCASGGDGVSGTTNKAEDGTTPVPYMGGAPAHKVRHYARAGGFDRAVGVDVP